MSEKQKNELDVAFEEFENECGFSKEIRRELITRLRGVISKIEVSEFDKGSQILAKMDMYKTLDGLLKSDEDISFKRLKVKLQRKDGETNGMVGQAVVSMLKEMRVNLEERNKAEGQAALNKAQEELQKRMDDIKKEGGKDADSLVVSEGELQECSSVMITDRPPDEPEDDE